MSNDYGLIVKNGLGHVLVNNEYSGYHYHGVSTYSTEIKRTIGGLQSLNGGSVWIDAVRQCQVFVDVPTGSFPLAFLKNIPGEYQAIIPPYSYSVNGSTTRWTYTVMTTSLSINPVIHLFLSFRDLDRPLRINEETTFGLKTFNDSGIATNDTRYSPLSLLATGNIDINEDQIISEPVTPYTNAIYATVAQSNYKFRTNNVSSFTGLPIDQSIDSNTLLINAPCIAQAIYKQSYGVFYEYNTSSWWSTTYYTRLTSYHYSVELLPCVSITTDKIIEVKWFAYDFNVGNFVQTKQGDLGNNYNNIPTSGWDTTTNVPVTPYTNAVRNIDEFNYMVADLTTYQ